MKKRMPKLALKRETVAALDSELAKRVAGGNTTDTTPCSHYATAGASICTGERSGLNNCTQVN